MLIVDRISQLPNGAPVDAGTAVELRRELDGTLLDTQLTDINGWVTFQANGSPGPVYTQVTIGGESRYRYGRAVAQVGSWFEGEWQSFMHMVQPGVLMSNDPDSLKVVPGTGLQVRVSPGTALAGGILGRYYDFENLSITSNGSGNSRFDLVVMGLHSGGSQVGRVYITVIQGTPSANPVDPAVPPIVDVAQLILGRVRVQSGVSVIQGSDISDRRLATSFVPDGSITHEKLADDAVGSANLQEGAVDSAALADDSVDTNHLIDGAVETAKIGDVQVTSAKLAEGAVTSGAIADGAVGTSDLADGSVTAAKLASNAVATVKVANDAVTEEKLSADVRTKLNASGAGAQFADTNFDGGWYPGTTGRLLATRNITLPAGEWLIETRLEVSATAYDGWTYGEFWLAGTGAPSGGDESRRQFRLVSGVPRMVVLTGRRYVSPTASTTYSSTAHAIGTLGHGGGGRTYIESGTLYVKAWRR